MLPRSATLLSSFLAMTLIGSSSALSAPPDATIAAAARASGVETLLVIEPSKEFPRHSEGDVEQLKDGRLLLAYSRFSGGTDDNAAAEIVARTSRDNGKTWAEPRLLVRNEGKQNVMSVSILRLKSGELLLFYLRGNGWNDSNMFVRRSSDECETLGPPVRVTVEDGYHVVNNDRVIQLTDGRVVVPAALHPCPDGTSATWSRFGIPKVFISDDDGHTWHVGHPAVPHDAKPSVLLQEPGVQELKDGRLWMWMRTDRGVQYQSFSDDRGEHWTRPTPGNLSSPCSPATVERIPWTGDLLCIWNDHSWTAGINSRTPEGKRTPLCLAISKDEGRTWSKSRVIEGDPDGCYCYTSMTFIKDRVILSYCAGDSKVGGLNRLKVVAISKNWLYPDQRD